MDSVRSTNDCPAARRLAIRWDSRFSGEFQESREEKRGVAKGARRSRKRFGSNLEPLSRVRLQYFEREGADLARIETVDLLESFYRLQEEPERAAVLACGGARCALAHRHHASARWGCRCGPLRWWT